MSELLQKLEKAFAAGAFTPFISSIRFPYFKNLEPGFSLDFTFPITAIVGPNGSNKSSILRALQSCPEGSSISDYWFDTALDHIEESEGTQRYIHSYRVPSGYMAEVMKQRVRKSERGDDYFETTRPRKRDGMAPMPAMHPLDEEYRSFGRWKPVGMNVVYLDFRAVLPAYDIFMNFNWRKRDNSSAAKKRLVRLRASRLSSVLADLAASDDIAGSERLKSPATLLSPQEVEIIGRILGKDYSEIRIVEHDYYHFEGVTALMKASNLSYSEAFAGSGEFAVVKLVHDITNAQAHSLILLDEPETSLHPGAQKALMTFLMEAALSEKHQIVISTHSSALIELLPDAGRKLVGVDLSTGKIFPVSQSASAEEAFERIGASYQSRRIIVEDDLAAAIVRRALAIKGEDYFSTFEIRPVPGGADTIRNRIVPDLAVISADSFIILDGDKCPAESPADGEVLDSELESELNKMEISSKNIIKNGGAGVTQSDSNKQMRTVLEWAKRRLRYLPERDCPENLLFKMIEEEPSETPAEAKQRWVERTREALGVMPGEQVSARDIIGEQRRALAKVSDDNELLVELCNTVSELLEPIPD